MTSRIFSKLVSFASAGAVGTLVQYAMLLALVEGLGANPVSSSVFGTIAGAGVNYLLSHHWVFRSARKYAETMPKFLAIAGSGILMNAAAMYLLVEAAGVHYFVSQIVATGAVFVWNFLGNHFWTFADETGNT